MIFIYLYPWGGGQTINIGHIHTIITSVQKADNAILTQVWHKPPRGDIPGYSN